MGIDYRCGTGHGVSYLMSVHEGPTASAGINPRRAPEDTVQEPGMVTTDEPGVYIEGSHGIRTENELVCRKLEENEYGQFLGFETITCAPIDLDAVIPEQMSPRQRGWLNDYHAFVRETLLPLMQDDDERAWLRHATRAINRINRIFRKRPNQVSIWALFLYNKCKNVSPLSRGCTSIDRTWRDKCMETDCCDCSG